MAKVKFNVLSLNRYTDCWNVIKSFRTKKSAEQWIFDELCTLMSYDWVKVLENNPNSIRLVDCYGGITHYKVVRCAA